MNLYFISAADPSGTDDRLDAFVYAKTEFAAYELWMTAQEANDRFPGHIVTPNYDLYLVPHDPMLRSRGIACVIPYSLDGTGGIDGSGVVQLIASSWMEPDRKPLALDLRERATVLAALRYWQRHQADLVANSQNVIPADIIATIGGQVPPMRRTDIDELCDRVIASGKP